MVQPFDPADPAEPEPFRQAVASLAAVQLRSEVALRLLSAPVRVAPYARAWAASAGEAASGRFVYLHDPDGQEAWAGRHRLVSFVRGVLEAEMADDPVLPEVAWSWLTDAFEAHGVAALALSGTVTVTSSVRFGELRELPATSEVELRCSWSPLGVDLAPHLAAFADLLAAVAGLPPEGTTGLPGRLAPGTGARPERPG